MVIITIASTNGIIYKDRFDDGMEFFCPEGPYRYFAWRLGCHQAEFGKLKGPFGVSIKDDHEKYVLYWRHCKNIDEIISRLLKGY